ncbi:MAG: hypothetical protein BMS9Abin02_0592 [Anaerolineae bacterium]|nr:MAG: hypothetical protein BMS9Abin02_0592 [Anaerolineae bacterium]
MPTAEVSVTALSLESIAETAAVKITPTTEEPKSRDIAPDAQSATREATSSARGFIAEEESPVDGELAEEVDLTAHNISGDVELQTAEAAASTPEVTVTIDLSATAENPPTIQLVTTPVLTLTIQPTTINTDTLNGIPIDEVIKISPETRERVKEIYVSGQAKGRYPNRFSKLGDSLIATPYFLTQFDKEQYNLGDYAYLQRVIDYFEGSFERYGVAIKAGLHSWGVFDPMWANKEWCQPNESLIACEIRLNNPSILLILLGSNDSGAPDSFDYNLRKVVDFSIENGIIPVLATKADRFEGPDNRNNLMLRQIAADYQIPLWDFDIMADTLPGRGLQEDQVHLTELVENNYTLPETFQSGNAVHNLTALMVLDAILQIVSEEID